MRHIILLWLLAGALCASTSCMAASLSFSGPYRTVTVHCDVDDAEIKAASRQGMIRIGYTRSERPVDVAVPRSASELVVTSPDGDVRRVPTRRFLDPDVFFNILLAPWTWLIFGFVIDAAEGTDHDIGIDNARVSFFSPPLSTN